MPSLSVLPSRNVALVFVFFLVLYLGGSLPVLAQAPANDLLANASLISNKANWCSGLAAFTNVGASQDGSTSTCGTPYSNVWFKFQAGTTYVKLDVKTGSSEGTIGGPEMTLWNSSNVVVACVDNSSGSSNDVSLERLDLTVGDWYYLSISTAGSSTGHRGTFTLCANDQAPYNHKVGAIELAQKNNWCSALAAYTNVGATSDGTSSTCADPNNNVWFKFQASTAYINFWVKTGGSEGTISQPEITLWNSSGSSVTCQATTGTSGDVQIEALNLTVNDWYHISVSTDYSSSAQQGTFSICANDQVPYNHQAGAIALTQKNNWCSALAAYTNVGATSDGTSSTCADPNNNVWFKFQASTAYINFWVKTGGSEGTISQPEITLWNSGGSAVTCQATTGTSGDVQIEALNLTVNDWYHISVSTDYSSSAQQGTFSICANDQASYNHKAGAIELTQKNNWCSALAAYTNVGATSDGTSSTCADPYNNVWFKFQASTAYMNFAVKTGGSEGTIAQPEITLWNAAGSAVGCQATTGSSGDVRLEMTNLTANDWYHISVSTNFSSGGYQGTFTICANDQPTFDQQVGATLLTQKNGWCSALAAYSNLNSTPDGSASTCSSPNNNVWFKFQAATSYLNFKVNTGDTEGTIERPVVTLWDAAGTALQCEAESGGYTDIELTTLDLVINGWYFISVATQLSSLNDQGTFSICVNDVITFDHQDAAVELDDVTAWDSEPAAYSNVAATSDGQSPSCGTPYSNVWFTFLAVSSYIKIDVKTGGSEGTIKYPEVALWNAEGLLMGCANSPGMSSDVSMISTQLTPGEIYFVSVQNKNNTPSDQGTFTLSVDDRCDVAPIHVSTTGSAPVCFGNHVSSVTLNGTEPSITYFINGLQPRTGNGGTLTWTGLSAGAYYIKAQRGYCTAILMDSVTLIQYSRIEDLALERIAGPYCGQDTLVIEDSQPGVLYQLKNESGLPIQSPKTGNGMRISWVGVPPSATYGLAASHPTGCSQDLSSTVFVPCEFQDAVFSGTLAVATPLSVPTNYTMAVDGKIIGMGLNLKLPSQWPDYVFDENYELPGLDEVERFIRQNKHLPNIPSAAEMKRKGRYSVAEMDKKLLEKIEELTLYLGDIQETMQIKQDEQASDDHWISAGAIAVDEASGEQSVDDISYSYSPPPPEVPVFGNVVISETLEIAPIKPLPAGYKVAVGGNVIATGIEIAPPQNWPDYVFDQGYELLTMEELRKYIRVHGHLPGIRSADEMTKAEVYALAELDAQLLERIEALSLYTIELNKKIGGHSSAAWQGKPSNKALMRTTLRTTQRSIDEANQELMSTFQLSAVLPPPNMNFKKVKIANTLRVGSSTQAMPENYKLAVSGNIIATSMDVKIPEKWPDYVFEENYALMPLADVIAFVRLHKHLPGIPSAHELEQVGDYSVSEIDRLLLEKVEELTLYVIQLNDLLTNRPSGN